MRNQGTTSPFIFGFVTMIVNTQRVLAATAFINQGKLLAQRIRQQVPTNRKCFFSVPTNKKSNPAPNPAPPIAVTLRNATIDDIPLLLKWDDQPHLSDPNVMGDEDYNEWNWEYELPRDEQLPWRQQLVASAVIPTINNTEAFNDIVPIGFIQIIDPLEEEDHYWGLDCEPNLRALDIWIGEVDYLGKGYGTQMMKQALDSDFIFGDPEVKAAIVDPMANNPKAHTFYQKIGFRPEENFRYFGPDKCLVHRLTREDYNEQNLKDD